MTITKSIQSWLRKTNIRPTNWLYALSKFWKMCRWKENMSMQSPFLSTSAFFLTQTEEESTIQTWRAAVWAMGTPGYQSKRKRTLQPMHGSFVVRARLSKVPTMCRKPVKQPTSEPTMNARTLMDELQPIEENDWKESSEDIATTVKEAMPS